MDIFYSPKFARQYKKLPSDIAAKAEKCERIFRSNPFDSRLKTHKLSGPLEGYYAFSISFSYRIICKFVDADTVRFYQIGTHDVYD